MVTGGLCYVTVGCDFDLSNCHQFLSVDKYSRKLVCNKTQKCCYQRDREIAEAIFRVELLHLNHSLRSSEVREHE